MNRLNKYKHINFSSNLLILIFALLSGCSTQIPVQKSPETIPSKQVEDVKEVSLEQTAQEKLTSAKVLSDLETTPELTAQINELLISSSELFFLEQSFSKALWLSNETIPLLKDNYADTYRLLLVKVKSLLALNQPQAAEIQLQLLPELVVYANSKNSKTPLSLTYEYYRCLQALLELQKQPVKALAAQLTAFSLNQNSTSEDILSLWSKLESLSQWQLVQLTKESPPFIKGWQQLLHYSHKFGGNSEKFSRYLSLWEQSYPTHPAMHVVKQLKTSTLSVRNIEHIAVLLPLSGSKKSAGLAAQQGILSAYKNDTPSQIHFFDTNKLDWVTLASQFTESSIDHVIGPLLKANVETYIALSEEAPALQIPSLLLNSPNNRELTTYQTVLSMLPEDEAIQAAATLSQKNYKKPIVLCHQDRVSKRLATAFNQQWKILTGNEVDIIYFNKGKQMQASLKKALDVDLSQTRIKQLKSRLKNNIKAESRNRRDIDMIYLIGSAAQTRLVKPYIDVNTSPFAKEIPIFASSRSHSNFNYKNNTGSTNDLQGLTFTQMPWLLTSNQQDKNLSQLSNQLWPRRPDSLSRIFAMGYDSYNLLNKVFLMQQAPYIRHYGQTGVLKLNSNNILTRSLIWGRYQNSKVMQIAMD